MKNSQKGFGAIEALLLLILISIVGFIGYYVYHTSNSANSSYDKAATASNTSKSSASGDGALTAEAASALVSDFYAKYYQAAGGSNVDATPDRDQLTLLVHQYGTANLINTYASAQAFDPIVCAQQVDPMTVVTSKVSGSKVVVTVRDSLASGAQNVPVDVVNSSGLKIDAVNCPINKG
jgi:Tfp pilus assembly protein PilV